MPASAFAADFPEADFREAIRETMRMGMPTLDSEKLVWRWTRARTFTPESPAGNPYDWTAPAVTDDPGNPTGDPDDDGVIVDYALQPNDLAAEAVTSLGVLNFQRLTVTLFDVDFEIVKTADYVTIGAVRYQIRFEKPPYALFGVTMHDIFIEAEDES